MKKKRFLLSIITLLIGSTVVPTFNLQAQEVPEYLESRGVISDVSITQMESTKVYSFERGKTLDLDSVSVRVNYSDGTYKTISGQDLIFSASNENYEDIVFHDSKHISLRLNYELEKEAKLVAIYTENGRSYECEVKFYQVKETSVNDTNYIGSAPTKLVSPESSSGGIILEQDDLFYLDDLQFRVTFENGEAKTIKYTGLSRVKVPSKFKDLVEIDRKNRISFTEYAEVGDYADVDFYFENYGVEVTTTIRFYLEEEDLFNEIPADRTKKPTSFKLKDKNATKIKRDEPFNIFGLNYVVTYDNETTQTVNGKSLSLSNFYIAPMYRDTIELDKNGQVSFKEDVELGTEAVISVTYQEKGKTFSENITFVLEKATYERVVSLTAEYPMYNITKGEIFEIEHLNFKAHYSNGYTRKVNLFEVSYSIPEQYADKIVIDKDTDTLYLKTDNLKLNEGVTVEFSITDGGIKRPVNVKFVYVRDTGLKNEQNPKQFTDISGHWAESSILSLANKNMLVGYEGTKYFPNRNVTRGEVAAFVSKFLNLTAPPDSYSYFKDLDENYVYIEDISKVYETGLIKGYQDGTYRADKPITREELATILLRVYKSKYGIEKIPVDSKEFADAKNISTWAKQSVMEAKTKGIIGGKANNMFAPKDYTTRAEMAVLIYRMLSIK